MSDTRRYLFDDVLLDAQQRDGEDDEGGAEDGEDWGVVVEYEDLEEVGHHDVRHPDEAHHHGAGQAEGLVDEEEGRDPERSDQQHSFVVEIEIIWKYQTR